MPWASLTWPVLLPGETWFGVFWSLRNIPADQPRQIPAGYFDSLVLAGRSFSPSSPLTHGSEGLLNAPTAVHLPNLLAKHQQLFWALIWWHLRVWTSGWAGTRVPAGIGGVCGCLCCGDSAHPVTIFVSLWYECWVHGFCAALVGMRGEKPGGTLYPLAATAPAASVSSEKKSPAGSQVLGECTEQNQNEKIKTRKDDTAPFLILFMVSLNHLIMHNINIAYCN